MTLSHNSNDTNRNILYYTKQLQIYNRMIVTINSWGKKNITSFIRVFCFPDGSAGKESTCNAGDLGSVHRLGRFPGEGYGYPLQYSGPEKSMNCIGHGVAKSRT